MFSWLKLNSKDSKQCCLSYEDAVKRVNDSELKRLKEAFKKISAPSDYASKQSFAKDVLGENIPSTIAEVFYTACGGSSKGISFKDVVSCLVFLTRSNPDEKIKFLFALYSNDSSTSVTKDEMLKFLHTYESGFNVQSITLLFGEKDTICYDELRDWLLHYPDTTCLSRWFLKESNSISLSNDLETPTFYQTLCGVTHLEEKEMIELEKRYWALKNSSRTGKLDIETLTPLLTPVLPLTVCQGLFNAFDENRDNHIDFKEMACGVSAACRGPAVERLKFCFKVFDTDMDGYLSAAEQEQMVGTIISVSLDNNETTQAANKRGIMEEMEQHVIDQQLGISLQEYLIWAVQNQLCKSFLDVLFQVCHVILALRPSTPQEEHDIVMGWLKRTERHGYERGQFWYLIDSTWWRQWFNYTLSDRQSVEVGEDVLGKSYNNLLNLDTSSINTNQSPSPRSNRKSTSAAAAVVNGPPGPILNHNLVQTNNYKVPSLTGEGGKLKKNLLLTQDLDFKIVPSSLWTALSVWYRGEPALPRQVILPANNNLLELELYPVNLKILRHTNQTTRNNQQLNWSNTVGGYGAAALGTTGYAYVTSLANTPKRYLAYVAAFSRMATLRQVYQYLCNKLRIKYEDVRLWSFRSENNMFILEDEDSTLEELGVQDDDEILLEIRNKDLTWPEEMNSIACLNHSQDKTRQAALEKGATGLNNLGNTCFMNSALQCVSNTQVLTQYFTSKMHLYELNRENPLGMKGHIALRYADLIQSIWSGNSKTIAPLKLRWTIGKYAPRFNGFQQHDSQELLAFLLDGLHEDLNRVLDKPYVELKDSDGRPDVLVAQEAWENHILRNKSIIVDLFHGQLKSKVTCKVCLHESVRFDPFNYLSLPLPMESYIRYTATVIKLDGSVPVKYGLRLNNDDKYHTLKCMLSNVCDVPSHLIKLCDIQGAVIKSVMCDEHKLRNNQINHLYAYELPPYSLIDDEKSSITSNRSQGAESESATFTAIQRATNQNIIYNHQDNLAWTKTTTDDLSSAETPQSVTQQSTSLLSSSASSSMGSLEPTPLLQQNGSLEGCVPHSSTHSSSNASLANLSESTTSGFLVALHRKMIRQETYFHSWSKTKPSLFGLPVIVPCNESTTHQDLYQSVWTQVARLVSPLPPSETAGHNHATDCDDSLGYEFPFTLKAVTRDGESCSLCPWHLFCRGCRIHCSTTEFNNSTSYLAVDWDPTALHLRYQTCLERAVIEHDSVTKTRLLMCEPISLDHCLETFTREETLSEDEKVYCSKCKSHEIATKKLQIWRLPPILIVHLKRFQFVNGKWIKSQKVVEFPFQDFDPTSFLASVPQETVVRHREQCQQCQDETVDPARSRKRDRLVSTSLSNTPVNDSALQDFHQHRLDEGTDPFHLKYNLYAVTCHSGMLGGGHYVSYACNPRGVWYCYNDSSCRQVNKSQMDLSSAYMLFYERQGLTYQQYMPNVGGRLPDITDINDDDDDSDFKKYCCLQ